MYRLDFFKQRPVKTVKAVSILPVADDPPGALAYYVEANS